MFALLLYQTGTFLARILPQRVSKAIDWTIGQVSCLVRWKTKRVVAENLRIVHAGRLPDAELRRKSRRVIMNFARCIHVFLKMPSYRWDELQKLCDFSEFYKAVEPLGEKPAFIITTAHIGPFELGGLCLSRMGYKVHTVALDHPSRRVTGFYDARRREVGVMAYPVTDSFEVLKQALDRGEVVALLTDRSYGRAKRRHSFFGIDVELPVGYLVLAVRCRVPVLTGAILLDSHDRFKYVHGGVYFPPGGMDESSQVVFLQDRCVSDFERIIERYSEQWFHFRPLKQKTG